jgi:CTP synthase
MKQNLTPHTHIVLFALGWQVFVLQDGGESDLDLGNYERFLNIELTSEHNITTGKIYRQVIWKERRGDYLGKTVQVVPHITNEIQDRLDRVAHVPVHQRPPCQQLSQQQDNNNDDDDEKEVADVCLIEVGGTVGDIESSIFLEALRQFQFRVGTDNFVLCFVSLVPVLSNEQKTKPTQHGVKDLRSLGLSPSIIFCRSTQPLLDATKQKISNFCHVPPQNVLSVHDVSNVYHVPLLLQEQNLHTILMQALHLDISNQPRLQLPPDLGEWEVMAQSIESFPDTVKIALIGKYTGLQDSYLSVIKSLKYAAIACRHRLELLWVEAAHLERSGDSDSTDNPNEKPSDFHDHLEEGETKTTTGDEYQVAWDKVKQADGVIVPGGFGSRGFEGKVLAAEYCRTHQVPYLGVCLGFQAMVVEYCRNVLGWKEANSTEFDPDTIHPVVFFMPEIDPNNLGGTMRLGARLTKFTHRHANDGDNMSTTQRLYGGKNQVWERHRHRYEVHPDRAEAIHEAGLTFCGRDETGTRMEIAELPRSQHPYYVGTQYHPEFLSRPLQPSPPFHGLLLAACGQLDQYLQEQDEQQGK